MEWRNDETYMNWFNLKLWISQCKFFWTDQITYTGITIIIVYHWGKHMKTAYSTLLVKVEKFK
jgi:hypothetical protein